MKRKIMCLFMALTLGAPLFGRAEQKSVSKVIVVFKTHLDIGFTDLSSAVERRYREDFIPKALDISERLKAEGASERYVWTTGSWLVWDYINQASPKQVERLNNAIERGDIVWNSVPYTYESETINKDLFVTALGVSSKLDAMFSKKTIAAKMTDVPGHTRSIITPLSDAGIELLHIGVNPATPIPDVPEYCVWQETNGKSLILMYQKDYGTEAVLPGGETVVAINFTGDNHGPHSYEQVKAIYQGLRDRYPAAEIVAGSFNEIAAELVKVKDKLPVVTSEIGDTWLYGYGGSPIRMAKFRALQRLYSEWIADRKIEISNKEAIAFTLRIGLIAEHTQGVDIKTHLHNWDKYDTDIFNAARSTAPFQKAERSWAEIDNYVDEAIALLPEPLRTEAQNEVSSIGTPKYMSMEGTQDAEGVVAFELATKKANTRIGTLTYQMFDSKDYDTYLNNYLRTRPGWALDDIGKTGLDKSKAVSVSLEACAVKERRVVEKQGVRRMIEAQFVPQKGVDPRVLPEAVYFDYLEYKSGKKAEVTVTIKNKPSVRLPEAYWFSFVPENIISIVAEKMDKRVDLMDVVVKGARQMHGIDRYVDIITTTGTVRIWSKDAFLMNVGEARGINYSTALPDKSGGVHFNLSNNLWGTNFTMWNEGSLSYRFIVEYL